MDTVLFLVGVRTDYDRTFPVDYDHQILLDQIMPYMQVLKISFVEIVLYLEYEFLFCPSMQL